MWRCSRSSFSASHHRSREWLYGGDRSGTLVGTLMAEIPEEERVFTLAEAQSLLPRLRSVLTEISDQWEHVRKLNPEVQKARDNAQFDGYSKHGVEYVEGVSHLMFLIHQIKDMGVLLKDAVK